MSYRGGPDRRVSPPHALLLILSFPKSCGLARDVHGSLRGASLLGVLLSTETVAYSGSHHLCRQIDVVLLGVAGGLGQERIPVNIAEVQIKVLRINGPGFGERVFKPTANDPAPLPLRFI